MLKRANSVKNKWSQLAFTTKLRLKNPRGFWHKLSLRHSLDCPLATDHTQHTLWYMVVLYTIKAIWLYPSVDSVHANLQQPLIRCAAASDVGCILDFGRFGTFYMHSVLRAYFQAAMIKATALFCGRLFTSGTNFF